MIIIISPGGNAGFFIARPGTRATLILPPLDNSRRIDFTVSMNTESPRVICCGHAAYDLNFMMDEYPVEDEKYKIKDLVQTGGGPAANAATLLARWGVKAAYAGIVGDDIYGRLIIEELEASGVDTSLVQVDGGKNTPLSAVIVNRTNGSRTLLNRRDETDQPAVTLEAVQRLRSFDAPAVLHFDGHALELSLKMMELYPDAQTVIDAGSFRAATDRLCAAADYAVCSRRYAAVCTGFDDFESEDGRQRCMRLLTEKYPGRVVVTLGADGLFHGARGHEATADGAAVQSMTAYSLAAYSVDAVDSTGAGDIFHAAFSFGVLRELSFEDKLRLASAAAALSVKKPGGRTSIPGLEESLKLAGLKLPGLTE